MAENDDTSENLQDTRMMVSSMFPFNSPVWPQQNWIVTDDEGLPLT